MNAVGQIPAGRFTENRSRGCPHTWDDRVFDELSAALFASLRRSDQRSKGVDYLRGLLGAQGRRSIRNMAVLLGGSATEQSLHHFVCNSTWDWMPVRWSLARHLAEQASPLAYVVRPMVIPKAGENSVGVDRSYVSEMGQLVNAQQATGVWFATEELSAPVNWRLHLSAAWLNDRSRRRQASIPEDVEELSPAESAVGAAVEVARGWGLPPRPVVLDARHLDLASAISRFRASGTSFLARVSGSLQLTVTDPALRGRKPDVLQAAQIMTSARDRVRPVLPAGAGADAGRAVQLAALVRVRPSRVVQQVTGPGELTLLGVGEGRRQWPTEFWLTDMTEARLHALVRLTRLTRRVEHDFRNTADRLGIRDFIGRSYGGWNRHVTLASAAHAVSVLGSLSDGMMAEAC
ncbi:transposase [Streptomyces phaeofaciens JCM 4814]|uniref:ISXo8 transposase n=1 Tax=Streptomyces phaeofaciens TaxID=68254 RepID=A0A918H3Z3_9ACTN|nr:transposase [Streptomyces phaeofaciens]GGT36358.1 putative ISXo8 transposase [Streptomyces phaeofaciens]